MLRREKYKEVKEQRVIEFAKIDFSKNDAGLVDWLIGCEAEDRVFVGWYILECYRRNDIFKVSNMVVVK